jgi:hypothetical protein
VTLVPLATDLWIAPRPLRVLGLLDIGTCMSVVRLPDGGVFLHSPVPADDATRAAVDAIGPLRAIVAPNRVHHFFAGAWKQAYPQARLLGAPGLAAKRKDLCFDAELGDGADVSYAGTLDQLVVRGAPYMSEVAFLHRPSRTLLLTDLAFHPTPASRRGARIWGKLSRTGAFGPNAVVRLCIRDRGAFRASLDRVLAWDFDRVTVTHGEPLETGGRDALRRAYAFLWI